MRTLLVAHMLELKSNLLVRLTRISNAPYASERWTMQLTRRQELPEIIENIYFACIGAFACPLWFVWKGSLHWWELRELSARTFAWFLVLAAIALAIARGREPRTRAYMALLPLWLYSWLAALRRSRVLARM